MRIVSLLPSLTELVHALGRGSELVGVTHECDFPPGVEKLPHLTRSRIAHEASSAAIDYAVSTTGGGLYELDETLLAALKPDLILTQEQCDVCAVNEVTVRRAAMQLPEQPEVISVNPLDLAGLFTMIDEVAARLDASSLAQKIRQGFENLSAEIAQRVGNHIPQRTLLLEWFDPPFCAGHWNPELIQRAGGVEVLGQTGEKSRRVSWDEIASAEPEVVLVSACGFSIERTIAELDLVRQHPQWQALPAVRNGRVYVTDGSAYFSRPGPRLRESMAIAAAAIYPELCGDFAPPGAIRKF